MNGYFRDESSTFLTMPEWYIVYSTDEYAAFIGREPPSRFPYFAAIRQYWSYYASVCRATKGVYPFDPGSHLMLGVIGTSFSLENAAKGAYEATIGRAAEWIGSHGTEEDAFAQRTALEYGTFMHTAPWYEFPFAGKLTALWRQTPWWGRSLLRKWERRLALSAEYGTKAAYGWVVRRATGAVYGSEDLGTHAWLDAPPDVIFADRRVGKIKEVSARSYIVVIPRYEAFTAIVVSLAKHGARFRDIAGNDEIVLTAIAPRDWSYALAEGKLVFAQEILTNPALKRVAVKTSLRSLPAVLAGLEARGARIEHLYDY